MSIALLIARLLLSLTFLIAGVAKLTDLQSSRKAMRDFGVPARLAPALGTALPVAELAVAVALVPRLSAWWGALGAAGLLLLFTGAISVNMAQGRKPDCNCFGQLHSEPVGWKTLGRNALFAALAAFILVAGYRDPGWSVATLFGALSLVQWLALSVAVVLIATAALHSWLLFHVLRQNGRLLARLDELEGRMSDARSPAQEGRTAGLPTDIQAPAFSLQDLRGERITLDVLRAAGKPVVLAFLEPRCKPCMALLPDIVRWQRSYTGKLTLAVISSGTPEANRAAMAASGITYLLLQGDREVAQSYHVTGTPSALLIRADGTVGSPLAQGPDQIKSLVAMAVGLPALVPVPAAPARDGNGNGHAVLSTRPQPHGLTIGAPAPAFALPDLDGETQDLGGFRGATTLVLFWSPTCGFCQRMREDLLAWEAGPPAGAPKLLVVSTGTMEANQAQGFRSPVLLDQGFQVGHSFGASGTPSAVLVDAQGQIASELGVGAPAVLALAGAVPVAEV